MDNEAYTDAMRLLKHYFKRMCRTIDPEISDKLISKKFEDTSRYRLLFITEFTSTNAARTDTYISNQNDKNDRSLLKIVKLCWNLLTDNEFTEFTCDIRSRSFEIQAVDDKKGSFRIVLHEYPEEDRLIGEVTTVSCRE